QIASGDLPACCRAPDGRTRPDRARWGLTPLRRGRREQGRVWHGLAAARRQGKRRIGIHPRPDPFDPARFGVEHSRTPRRATPSRQAVTDTSFAAVAPPALRFDVFTLFPGIFAG